MLSKNDVKNIKSLEQKKFRREKGLFIAEGPKLTGELLGKFECILVAASVMDVPAAGMRNTARTSCGA